MPRGLAKKTIERNLAAAKVPEEQILELFEFWKTTLGKTNRTKLDHPRRVSLGNAIYHYGMDGAKDAIRGCSYSDFHMGRNKNNVTYNGIDNIFKDNERIEKMFTYLPSEENYGKW